MMHFAHVTFKRTITDTRGGEVGLLEGDCNLELREEIWAGDTEVACLSSEVMFKPILSMVEITQEENVAKTETRDVPTLTDLTEEECQK